MPFALEGSGGSTPLRITVAGGTDPYLFGKLYAVNHLRSDRWCKLGRTLLHGGPEDERAFNSVRRLVQPGARRYERLHDVADGYDGERYDVYDGGCTTLTFRLSGQDRAEQVGEASLAVGFLSRQELRDSVRRRSDGRLELDDGAGAW